MDRDDFIIYVYELICEYYQKILLDMGRQQLRQRGFKPKLSDEEVITMEICAEYWGIDKDKGIYEYFRAHYAEWFPELKDRTSFTRQAANLWQIKSAIQQQLVNESNQASDIIQTTDTLPLPVCVYTRSYRDKCFKPEADYGYCAAKQLDYYGFKLGLRISRLGMITHYPLLPARPHDINFLADLIDNFQGIILADKGFIGGSSNDLWKTRGVKIITPNRKNMKKLDIPYTLMKQYMRFRKGIETVISQLTERFSINRIRTRDLWHYKHRITRKVLAHTICVFMNLQLGRSPLDFEGLISY